MAKLFAFDEDAREKLYKGLDQLARAVTITMGPKGQNVVIDKKWGTPHVVHDGVTVAKDVYLPDPFENMGAQLIKEAAENSGDRAGDGTTTATLLASEIAKAGRERIKQGHNPQTMLKGMKFITTEIVNRLKQVSKSISTPEEIEQVATISSADPVIGKMISEAMEKIGKNGTITVDESKSFETTVRYTEGLEFEKGFGSPYFITNSDKEEAELKEVNIIITNEILDTPTDLAEGLRKLVEGSDLNNFLLIAPVISPQVLNFLILNRTRGSLRIIPVYAPFIAEKQEKFLEDLAILTGGEVISKKKGMKLEDLSPDWLGHADLVWSDKNKTRVIGGKGNQSQIVKRQDQIKGEIEREESDYEKQQLKERLAKMTDGVAVIEVGANTEAEMKEKKERVIDAVEATKSAVEEGIIPGGGIALLNIGRELLENKLVPRINKDEQAGVEIILNSLDKPLRKITENAGADTETQEGILKTIYDQNQPDFGFDVETEEYGKMMERGIVDPTKVTRTALENAVSVAGMILTARCLITDEPEDEANLPSLD